MKHLISSRIFHSLVFTLVISSLSPRAESRWLTPPEADVSIESETIRVRIADDGKTDFETSVKIKILNETGRNRFGTMKFSYTPKSEKFKILKAETHNGDTVLKVNSGDIVDTAVGATENGFDEFRQVLIPFQEVQVGSILVYSYKSQYFRPALENHHTNRYMFGRDLQNHLDVMIESSRPLFMQVNDPTASLKKTEKKEKNKYQYHFQLERPLFQQVAHEVRSIIPDQLLTWIVFSTSSSYEELFGKLSRQYNRMLKDPLPPIFQDIVDQARKEKELIPQLNLVLSLLSEKIRYMGDWRAVDGGFVPRSFATIAATRFGDCKDMSLLTSRMLQDLGHNANVALVVRGGPPPSQTDVPYFSFNHAIVSVQTEKQQLWLDPTNFQSFAQGVPEDIADRPSLILTGSKMNLRKIEFTPPEENTEVITYKIKFVSEQRRVDQIDYQFTGNYAFKVTGNELRYSKEQIQEETISSLVDQTDVISYRFDQLDLKDRIVKPIHMKFHIDRHYRSAPTSVGPGFVIYPSSIASDFNKLDIANRVSYLYLGPPSVSESVGYVENFKIKGNRIANCDFQSPWLDHTNQVLANAKPVTIRTRLRVKKYWITTEEMKSPEFQKLQENLKKCGSERYLIYSLIQKGK